jgi:GNAT superfamily N-acetyltransferase
LSQPPKVEDDRFDSNVAEPLVRALGLELVERYGFPDPDPDGLTSDDLAPPTGAFVIAWLGSRAVGCGGVRRYAARVGELKRMFVAPPFRGRGVSRLVLAALEERARALGYGRLILETGVRQPEALRLYETSGYTPIDAYGFYRTSPLSRCYAKALGPDDAAASGVRSGRRGRGGSSDPGTPSPR